MFKNNTFLALIATILMFSYRICIFTLGTLRYGDYGLRLDVCFSLAEILGRVHNEWSENAKLRLQTTENRLRTKSEGQLYTKQTQNVF